MDEYTSKLFDRVIELTHILDNLRTGYIIVNERFNKMSFLVDDITKDDLVAAIQAEQFTLLTLNSCQASEKIALLSGNSELFNAAHQASVAAEAAHNLAVQFSLDKTKNQTAGGAIEKSKAD